MSGDPVVFCAADNGYAMPLAVVVRSVLDRLDRSRGLRLYVLDGGIDQANKERLLRSWDPQRIHVEWIRPDTAHVSDLHTSHHVNEVAYFRILAPALLPESVDKAIYLDSDLVAMADIGRLWDEPLAGKSCLAVPDVSSPYIDPERSLPNYRKCAPYLETWTPIVNHVELGIDPGGKYFNSGVLVIDFDRWRKDDISGRVLACLREHRESIWCWDQYGLNAVLAGSWGALDVRWNQGTHIFDYPGWDSSPVSEREYVDLIESPYIIHYTRRSKPWHYGCRHPRREEFFKVLDRTDWAGWRPARPALGRFADWHNYAEEFTRRVTRARRKFELRFGSNGA